MEEGIKGTTTASAHNRAAGKAQPWGSGVRVAAVDLGVCVCVSSVWWRCRRRGGSIGRDEGDQTRGARVQEEAGLREGMEMGRPGWAAALLLSLSLSFSSQKQNRERPKESREKAMEKNKIVGYFCKALWNISNPTK